MALRDPRNVFITLHTTGGAHFSVNVDHILWIDHANEPTSHTLYVLDGVGAPTAFIINHAHYIELTTATPFVFFVNDLSPEG